MKIFLRSFMLGTLCCFSSTLAAPHIWDGSADTTWFTGGVGSYEITTPEQLAGLAKMVNDGTHNFEAIKITLGADIFLNDTSGAGDGSWKNKFHRNWTPIKGFKGNFDGSAGEVNHKIYGLYVNSSSSDYVGLFGSVSNARISNLDILVGDIWGSYDVGALAGSVDGGSVTNVRSEVNVNGLRDVGGLVGISSGTILSCHVNAAVYGGHNVGGVVGYASGLVGRSHHIGGEISGTSRIGGLVGYSTSAIENSYSEGNIIGKKTYVGGLVGYGKSVYNSHAKGSVKSDSGYVGGVAGYMTGTIDSSYYVGGGVSGFNYIGGLVGYTTSSVLNSYSKGDVTGLNNYVGGLVGYTTSSIENSYSEGNVTGLKDYVGGLIGGAYYHYDSSVDSSITILDNSYAIGDVKGNTYVGGLVGQDSIYRAKNNSTHIEQIVRDSHSQGHVEGKMYVGGIIGKSCHGAKDSTHNHNFSGKIVSSYHSDGSVIGSSNYVGGIAGFTDFSITNSSSKGNVSGASYVGGLVGDFCSSNDCNAAHKISKSYVNGSVLGTSDYVGGIAGRSRRGIIDSSYHTDGDVSGGSYVGGLIGYTLSPVTNSFSEGDVAGTESYIGGLVGYSYNRTNSKAISNCYAKGSISGDSNYVGGVAGYVDYTVGGIDSSYHIGGDVSGLSYVGGLVGYTRVAIIASHSEGNVTGKSVYVGGLVGYSESREKVGIFKSYTKGNVKNDSSYVGGVVGYMTTLVDSSYHIGGDINGTSYVGGLVGYTTSFVANSYSEGDVIGTGNNVGGLIGIAFGEIYASMPILENSRAFGNVKGSDYIGGLIGQDSVRDLMTRYIHNSHSQGRVEGNMYVGGVIGKLNYNMSSSNTNDTFIGQIISSGHSDGDVTGMSNYVGGVAGYFNGFIDSCYHVGGDVVGDGNYVGGLVGLSLYYFWRFNSNSPENISALSNSYVSGNVKGDDYVGGLVGLDSIYIGYAPSIDVNRYIRNSYSQGTIEGKKYVGGLVGKSNYEVAGSASSKRFSGEIVSSYHSDGNVIGTQDYVGGIAGDVYESIDSCHHAFGDVNGAGYVGGLAGKSSTITNSYSEGDVFGTKSYVGGLVGSGNVSKSYVKGAVRSDSSHVGGVAGNGSIDSSYHIGGSVCGAGYVGGLTGYSKVTNSYSEGDVIGTKSYVGGLAGSGGVSKSHAKGSVRSDSSYVGGVTGAGDVDSSYHIGGGITGAGYVGGLAGRSSKISNSYSEGNVRGTKTYVGGLAGYVSSKNIQKSYSKGTVKSDSSYVGGVVGYIYGRVDSSYHIGGNVIGAGYVGGLVGYASSSVKSSYSEGDVIGTTYVGGLVGAGGAIAKSYVKGSVVGSSFVGGIIGHAKYNEEGIDSAYHTEGHVIGTNYVGGLAGYSGRSIKNSYSAAFYVKGVDMVGGLVGQNIENIVASYFIGDSVIGNSEIGGLVGYVYNNGSVDSSYSIAHVKGNNNIGGLIGSVRGNVSNSYATGNVIGDADSPLNCDNLGGLVGYQFKGSVSKSLALGNVSGDTKIGGLIGRFDGSNISQSYAGGNVKGKYHTGGLVGYGTGSMDEVYASGIPSFEVNPVYTGCIIGYVNGSLSISKSYYDKTKCNLGVDGGENVANVSGTPGKTTAEMQYQPTFEDWDFTNTWQIEDGSYPYLWVIANSLAMSVVSTESLEDVVYDGMPKTPRVTKVSFLGKTLVENVDYTVRYERNINAGTAKISVCGINLYNSCKNIEFEIIPIPISLTIASIENMTYTGEALTPNITVYNGESILEATNYMVEYTNNLNAGTASVTVTMKGNYVGSATANFTIEKATPVISQNPKASDVLIGETLALSNLSGGISNVEGAFVWKTPEVKPTIENEGYAVKFIPTDVDNYYFVEMIIPIKVWDVAYVAVHLGDMTLDSAVVIKGRGYVLPAASDSVGYDFAGFYNGTSKVGDSGDQIIVNENTVLDAVYEIKTFVVKFVNGDSVLQSEELVYGSLPEYTGETPTKAATDQYTYMFKGWSPTIANVSGAKTYTAVFDSVVNKYLITFMHGENELQSDEVEYGKTPTEPMVTLPKNTAQYTYSFDGWDKPIVAVTGAETYYAVINRTLNKYEITFKDYDGSILKTAVQYDYGTPSINIVKPSNSVRQETAKYTYTFKGWSPTIADVTENAVYVAEYDSTIQEYQIVFVNGNDELQSEMVLYGEVPSYKGMTPKKQVNAQWTYTFNGWSPVVSSVVGPTTYAAVFDSVINKYEVVFKDYDGSVLKAAVQYDYGTSSINIAKPANPTRQETVKYTYSFKGWNPIIADVMENAVYIAEYDSTIRGYQILFVDGNDELLSETVAYGEIPTYNDVEPSKPSTAQYTYTFKGWTPSISSVTDNATYTAVFDSTLRKYSVSFVSDGSVLETASVAYGDTPKYLGENPTKPSTKSYSYEFIGWSPNLGPIEKDVKYIAVFDSTLITGIVDANFANQGLSVEAVNRNIHISEASIGEIYVIFDMQGRVLRKGRVDSSDFNITMPIAGNYLVKIGYQLRRVNVR